LAGSSAAATTPATTTTPAAATNPATAQQNAASASSGSASALPAATQAGQTPPSGAATAQPAINPQAVSSTAVAGQPAAAPDIVPPTGQPAAATQTVQVLTAEDFLHDWTRANGEPLVYASFQQVTPSGDVRVTLVPRQWKLAYDDPSYEYQAFSGTFWAFYQKLGTPVMVRIGDVSIPGALNYVDIPRDQFSEEDRDYLAHLEGLQDYAYVNKGRVRYYTFPWEAISVEDQQYVYKLIAYLTAAQPAVASVQQPPSAAAGAAPPGVPPQATEALPQSSGPPAASAPQEAPAGPSDLPVTEMVPAVEPPADSSPQGPRPPYGY